MESRDDVIDLIMMEATLGHITRNATSISYIKKKKFEYRTDQELVFKFVHFHPELGIN